MNPDTKTTLIGVATAASALVVQLVQEGKLKPEFLIILIGIAVLGWKSKGTGA
jgi:hypothetical protein